MPTHPFFRTFSKTCAAALQFTLVVAALALPAGSHAASAPQPAAKARPAPAGVRVERDIPYVTGGDPAQVLDLYLPEVATTTPRPLLVWIHGGGWQSGSKNDCPLSRMVLKGYVVASVEYRFSQKARFPAQIQDCQAAIRWLRAKSATYGIDPKHVGVGGGSAGGHLAALVGTAGGKNAFPPVGGNETQSDRVQAVYDLFGPTDFNTVGAQIEADPNVRNIFKLNTAADPYSSLTGSKIGADEKVAATASPVHYVSADNPPFLIMHGTHDTLVPFAQSEEFAAVLQKAGVSVLFQKFPGSGHGGRAFGLPPVTNLLLAFFDKHLKGADVKPELVPEAVVAVPPPAPKAN